jgi:hypothetical protein
MASFKKKKYWRLILSLTGLYFFHGFVPLFEVIVYGGLGALN